MASSTNTVSGNINFQGLGSGTDFSTVIDGLVKIEGRKKTMLQATRQGYEDKNTEFKDLNTKLLTLKSSLEGMNSLGKFLTKSSESSNTAVLTATPGPDAVAGASAISVNQLAQNDIHVSGSFAVASSSAAATTNASTLKFDYAGSTGQKYAISIPAGSSLDYIAATINRDAANPGIRASVIKVADNDFRLRIYGLDTGATNQVENLQLVDNTTSGNVTTFAQSQNAQNAQFRVDGFPASGWLERSSNSVTDAIPGLSLLFKSTGTATLTTTTDTDAIKERIQGFVDQVNEVRTKIRDITKVDDTTNKASILTGNYGVQLIDQRLKDITATAGAGFDYLADTYSALSQVGVKTDATQGSATQGLLVLDEEALDAALAKNPDAVAEIFSDSLKGATDSANFSFSSCLPSSTQAGSYEIKYTVSGGSVSGATIGGYAATWSAATKELTGVAGTPVAGLAIRVNNLADSSYSGTVRIKNGKANELISELKKLTDANSGPLAIMQKSYLDTMDEIDKKIEFEENRLYTLQKTLKDRYSRLDALLTQYQSINSSLTSQITSMNKDK